MYAGPFARNAKLLVSTSSDALIRFPPLPLLSFALFYSSLIFIPRSFYRRQSSIFLSFTYSLPVVLLSPSLHSRVVLAEMASIFVVTSFLSSNLSQSVCQTSDSLPGGRRSRRKEAHSAPGCNVEKTIIARLTITI